MTRNTLIAIAGILWIGFVSLGFAALGRYESTPGPASERVDWPTGLRPFDHPGRAQLVFFAHPRCPCTRASMTILDTIAAKWSDQVDVHVFLLQPTEAETAWIDNELRRQAERIPNANVRFDHCGRHAAMFGAKTSGQTMLYNQAGRLVFRGGLNSGRGLAQASLNPDSIGELLAESETPIIDTSVFGCQLFP